MKRVAVKTALAIVLLSASAIGQTPSETRQSSRATDSQAAGTKKQLLAVRGEVSHVATRNSELVEITVKPGRDFPEVTVVARQNDLVGNGVSHAAGTDLLGLFAGGDESRENEKITAAELQQGDVVSVIYDPVNGNRALEIYIH